MPYFTDFPIKQTKTLYTHVPKSMIHLLNLEMTKRHESPVSDKKQQ